MIKYRAAIKNLLCYNLIVNTLTACNGIQIAGLFIYYAFEVKPTGVIQ